MRESAPQHSPAPRGSGLGRASAALRLGQGTTVLHENAAGVTSKIRSPQSSSLPTLEVSKCLRCDWRLLYGTRSGGGVRQGQRLLRGGKPKPAAAAHRHRQQHRVQRQLAARGLPRAVQQPARGHRGALHEGQELPDAGGARPEPWNPMRMSSCGVPSCADCDPTDCRSRSGS